MDEEWSGAEEAAYSEGYYRAKDEDQIFIWLCLFLLAVVIILMAIVLNG